MSELKALVACLEELKQTRGSIRKALDDLDAPEERTATRKAQGIRDRITRELTKLSLTRPVTPACGNAVERLDHLPDRLLIDNVDMLIQVVEAVLEAGGATDLAVPETASGITQNMQGKGTRTGRSRGPDIEVSRRRTALVRQLRGELAQVAVEQRKPIELDALKKKFPEFTIWKLMNAQQQNELFDTDDWTPKGIAEDLVLVQFAITSTETLKKDRKKLRKHASGSKS